MTYYNGDQLDQNERGWLFYTAAFACWREIMHWTVGPNVLDVGCGSGIALALMKVFRPGWKVVGLEGAQREAAMARGIDTVGADREGNFPANDGTYDTVFTSHVLEHVGCPDLILSESMRVSRNRVIHVVPDGDVQDKNFGTPHMTVFNRRNFAELLGNAYPDQRALTIYPIPDPHMNSFIAVYEK